MMYLRLPACLTAAAKPGSLCLTTVWDTLKSKFKNMHDHETDNARQMLTSLLVTQVKIAIGLTIHGLLAGIAIALGGPLIVLNFAPTNAGM